MGIVLGANQWGKAEVRLVHVARDTPRHEIRDLTVSTALRGDMTAAHRRGDQSAVLPTDTQKNTVYAYAHRHGIGAVEDFALLLARHFVADVAPVTGARVAVDEHGWDRAPVGPDGHDHAFVRRGAEVHGAVVEVDGAGERVVSGLRELVLLKSTGSEFAGFLVDGYTTLQPTHDRVMATSLDARWTHADGGGDWDATRASVRALLVDRFATVHSLALQQTLWEMGRAVLQAHDGIAEIALTAPNRHHFEVDLTPFGVDNGGRVFFAADRPYGLIEAVVTRE